MSKEFKITEWEKCLIEEIRKIQNNEYNGMNAFEYSLEQLFDKVNERIIQLSKENICDSIQKEETLNIDDPPKPEIVNLELIWEEIKQREWSIFLLPQTDRSNELKLVTKNSLIALNKNSLIKIEKRNEVPFYMLIEKVEEFNGCISKNIHDMIIAEREMIRFTGYIFDDLNSIIEE